MKDLAKKIHQISYQRNAAHLDIHEIRQFPEALLAILFPQRRDYIPTSVEKLEEQLQELSDQLCHILEKINHCDQNIDFNERNTCDEFFQKLPGLLEDLYTDAQAIYQGDPAAHSLDEVILSYPSFFAIATYRMAHILQQLKTPYFPRILTEYAHEKTGIDIHPAAQIGQHFCIDHGTGVVIGETTTIGQHVKIYQGVTLGALSVDKSMAHTKRHPTIEDRVVIYANTTILGGETVIGEDSIIGGNSWITQTVPAKSKIHRVKKR